MTLDIDNTDNNITNFLTLASIYLKNTPTVDRVCVGEFLMRLKTGFETHPEITPEYTYGWLEKINRVLALHVDHPLNVSICDLLKLLPSSYSPNWFNEIGAQITGTLTF